MAEEFNKLLDEYQANYVQFLTTGIPDYERAYKNAQTAIEKILDDKRQRVDKEKKDMKHFAASYKEDNEDLGRLFNSASTMYQDAQSIQDQFETAKQRYDQFTETPEPSKAVDVSNGYKLLLRIGVILILIPVLFLLGYYLIRQPTTVAGISSLPAINITSPSLSPMSR
jgi:hypothetical protein